MVARDVGAGWGEEEERRGEENDRIPSSLFAADTSYHLLETDGDEKAMDWWAHVQSHGNPQVQAIIRRLATVAERYKVCYGILFPCPDLLCLNFLFSLICLFFWWVDRLFTLL